MTFQYRLFNMDHYMDRIHKAQYTFHIQIIIAEKTPQLFINNQHVQLEIRREIACSAEH